MEHICVNMCLFICGMSVIIKVLCTHYLTSKQNFFFQKMKFKSVGNIVSIFWLFCCVF